MVDVAGVFGQQVNVGGAFHDPFGIDAARSSRVIHFSPELASDRDAAVIGFGQRRNSWSREPETQRFSCSAVFLIIWTVTAGWAWGQIQK